MDSGLHSLALTVRIHQVPVDTGQLEHQFGNLPLLAADAGGDYFLLARIQEQENGARRYLVQQQVEGLGGPLE
jgi:hypothetical protein